MGADLQALNPSQKEAILHTDRHVLILAGAGSGKTRVITRKVAFLIEEKGVSPYAILAITFTNKAAEEMRSRLSSFLSARDNQLLQIRTFHSFGALLLRSFIEAIPGYDARFTIVDTEDRKRIIKEVCETESFTPEDRKYMLRLFSLWKGDFLYPDADLEYLSRYETNRFPVEKLQSVYERYQGYLRRNNLVDFDDLIAFSVHLLNAGGRCFQYVASRWKHVLVDEYQDTNIAQEQILSRLVAGGGTLTAVGDDDQAIYSFRGGSIENIRTFPDKYQNVKIVRMDKNYRSTASILDLANDAIAQNSRPYPKKLYTDRDRGDLPLSVIFQDEREEAEWVSEQIASMGQEGVDYRDIAVLYRTHYQSRGIEDRLLKRDIPYQIIGGVKFYQRKEIKDALAYLTLIVNPRDANAFRRIVNYPPRGIGEKSQAKIASHLERHPGAIVEKGRDQDLLETLGPRMGKTLTDLFDLLDSLTRDSEKIQSEKFIADMLDRTGIMNNLRSLPDEYDRDQRLGNLNQLLESAREFRLASPDKTLVDFIQDAALKAEIDNLKNEKGTVKLMTVHNAKGLEFSKVFIIGLEERVFPHYLCSSPEEIEEERRLFYVGVTRAKDHLFITSSLGKFKFGIREQFWPSRFFQEIRPEHLLSKLSKDRGIFEKMKLETLASREEAFTGSGEHEYF